MPTDEKFEVREDAFLDHPECHLFNTAAFFRMHAAGKGRYFQLCSRSSGAVAATLHFTEVQPGRFCSPARGTFGGISASRDLPLEVLDGFLGTVEDRLRALGADEAHVALPPASHDLPLFSSSFNAWTRLGYRVLRHELNFDLQVDARPLAERMQPGNRKRYNKCLRAGFSASELEPAQQRAAYELIATNRRRRGFPMTMSFAQVAEMVERFPDRVKFFGVRRGDELLAASVCMLVRRDVLYVLYWGDADGVQDHSPVVPLAAAIYAYCQSSGLRLMDAGTSTVEGEPNFGLIRFKRGLGFTESLKLTLSKRLSGA